MSDSQARLGVIYALLAYVAWGISPLFWRELAHMPPAYILANRVLWAGVFFAILLGFRGRASELRGALTSRSAWILLAAAVLLAANWFVYLYAVYTNRILDASLGYFINPLVNVVLGLAFLKERLRAAQWVAVALAALGVGLMAVETAGTPWISLTLASTFGIYGLMRKTVRHDALLGSNIEMLFMLPFALPLLFIPGSFGAAPPPLKGLDRILLVCAGLQTALPLLWFSNAARRLPLSTLGFLQYIAPSMQLLMAVLVFKEPFGGTQVLTFVLIWLALTVMTIDAQVGRRRGSVASLSA